MARIGKAQRALDRSHKHRETIERLLVNPHQLSDRFLDWADSQLRRDRFYIYSEKEHSYLARELERMRLFDGFDGLTIRELVRAAMKYRADCDLPDQEFLDKLNTKQPTKLPLWQLMWLVGICRHIAGMNLPFQAELEPVADQADAELLAPA
jgi:hypothetical protein